MSYQKCILCTTGPALCKQSDFIGVYNAGCSHFRIALSKIDRDHLGYIEEIQQAQEVVQSKLSIFIDLPTARLRVGKIPKTQFKNGDVLTLIDESDKGEYPQANYIPISYLKMYSDLLSPADIITMKDGRIKFKVLEVGPNTGMIRLECVHAFIGCDSYSSVTFENKNVKYKKLRKYDEEFLTKLQDKGITPDWLIVSFAENGADIVEIKALADSLFEEDVKIMAKVENEEGVLNIEEIVEVADGILIGRGDLCENVEIHKVPYYQSKVQKASLKCNKLVIAGTQFMEKYASSGKIGISEVNDIYYTLIHSNGILLSGESGGSPLSRQCVGLLNEAIQKYEKLKGW